MISTYIWGENDEQVVPNTLQIDDSLADSDNDWILVNISDKQEHPSMSVYGPLVNSAENSEGNDSAESTVPTEQQENPNPQAVMRRQVRNTTRIQQLHALEHSKQIANESRTKLRARSKATKRQNIVHMQQGRRSKRNKRRDMKDGKHVGLHGKRGS